MEHSGIVELLPSSDRVQISLQGSFHEKQWQHRQLQRELRVWLGQSIYRRKAVR